MIASSGTRVIQLPQFPRSPSPSPSPSPPPPSQRPPSQIQTVENPSNSTTTRRHAALLIISLPSFLNSQTPSSFAFSFGISGPKEWLRDQKKKASRFVLAPIQASRQSLQSAYLLLKSEEGNAEEIGGMLNSATRDCVLESRSSIVAFQAKTGVEVCTFKLIVKNAASLLDDADPVKVEAENRLGDLIRSLTFLDAVVDKSNFQVTSDREMVKDGLLDSISALEKFEQGIKDCLGV